jgi:hypothetical protein
VFESVVEHLQGAAEGYRPISETSYKCPTSAATEKHIFGFDPRMDV